MRSLRRSAVVVSSGLAAIAVAATTLAGVGSSGADAATPAGGTISTASATTTWTAGPFLTPNVTGSAGTDPVCSTATVDCDDFVLTVDVPTDYTGTVKIDITATNGGDYDLYVRNAQGTTVATSTSSGDEHLTIPAVAGTYTLTVVPWLPQADGYDGVATLAAGSSTPAPTPDPAAPRFQAFAAPASLPNSNDAGEPSIGNNFKTGATLYQAIFSTYKVDFDDSNTPAKAAWSDRTASLANGCAVGDTASLDPILFTDHATGRTFQSQLSGVNSLTCWTDDDGVSWHPSTGGGIPSGVDHQTIGGGPFSAVDPVGGIAGYPDVVYYCSQDIASAFCAASHDGGTTFGAGVPTWTVADCSGLHGHVKVAPDGTAYVPNKDCNGEQAVAVSENGGVSWTVRRIPGTTGSGSDASVGVARNGTVYAGYVDGDGKPGVAVSHDQGRTWGHVQAVGSAYGIQNAVFPAVVAGDDDRAAIAYLGTPTAGNPGATGSFPGVWHLYVDTTYDGGQTWVTSDVTPNDPVQRGSICTDGTTCGDDRNLLDFIDATIDDHGRVLVGYADGCVDACVTDASSTMHAAWASIGRQDCGNTLFSKYDGTDPCVVAKVKGRKTRGTVG